MSFHHIPVLLNEVLDYLNPQPGETYADGTLGGGGHSEAILKVLGESGALYGIDRDTAAIAAATERIKDYLPQSFTFYEVKLQTFYKTNEKMDCMMLVPESLKGIARQRERWAKGGMEILRRHKGIFKSWNERRLFPVYCEQIFSIVWSLCWLLMLIIIVYNLIFRRTYIQMPYIWKSLFLSTVCLVQFAVAMLLDRKYDPKLLKHSIVAIWYPFVYWYINALIVIKALPSLFTKRGKLATWKSPDRGIGTKADWDNVVTLREDAFVPYGQRKVIKTYRTAGRGRVYDATGFDNKYRLK